MAKMKRWKIIADKNIAQLELSYNAEGVLLLWKTIWQCLPKLNICAVYDPTVLVSHTYPTEMKMCSPKDAY